MPFQFTCKRCGIVYTRPHRRRSSSFCSRACFLALPTEERFWSKVDRSGGPDACWPWLLRSGPSKTYGLFGVDGRTLRAHRIAWALANGRNPGSLFVLHECDNPPCCNPRHLHLGTNRDNAREMSERGRAPRGEKSGRAVLTEQDVRDIRVSVGRGELHGTLARQYGVSRKYIRDIAVRTSWKHVEGGTLALQGRRIGERNHAARLTESDVREIRRRFAHGEGISHISRIYGVWPETIGRVVHRKTWRHVT